MSHAVHTHWVEQPAPYDGSQLHSHFAYRTHGILGESLVAWRGPCHVDLDALVDLEDVQSEGFIRSRDMLHFIAEHFQGSLDRTVLRQRLLVAIAADAISDLGAPRPERRGDDLYHEDRKLSVSIATASPVSTMVHFGLNIDAADAPVPAADLTELGLDAERVAAEILARYAAECESIERARRKVRGVP